MSAIDDRFWSHVSVRGDTECWPWQGTVNRVTGQGKFTVHLGYENGGRLQKQWMATRFAYTLAHGEIPNGALIYRVCATQNCCNPAHLRAGNNSDKTQAALARGTYGHEEAAQWMPQLRGTANPGAKLSAEQVREIRAARALPKPVRLRELAAKYGVRDTTISKVARALKYKDV